MGRTATEEPACLCSRVDGPAHGAVIGWLDAMVQLQLDKSDRQAACTADPCRTEHQSPATP